MIFISYCLGLILVNWGIVYKITRSLLISERILMHARQVGLLINLCKVQWNLLAWIHGEQRSLMVWRWSVMVSVRSQIFLLSTILGLLRLSSLLFKRNSLRKVFLLHIRIFYICSLSRIFPFLQSNLPLIDRPFILLACLAIFGQRKGRVWVNSRSLSGRLRLEQCNIIIVVFSRSQRSHHGSGRFWIDSIGEGRSTHTRRISCCGLLCWWCDDGITWTRDGVPTQSLAWLSLILNAARNVGPIARSRRKFPILSSHSRLALLRGRLVLLWGNWWVVRRMNACCAIILIEMLNSTALHQIFICTISWLQEWRGMSSYWRRFILKRFLHFWSLSLRLHC